MGTVRDSPFLVCRSVNSLRCLSTSDHSLGHTFTVKLVQANVYPKISRRLLVYQAGSDVESRVYLGSLKYDVKELSDALEALRFPMMISCLLMPRMKKVLQAGVISGVVLTTGVQIWKNPGDDPHANQETQAWMIQSVGYSSRYPLRVPLCNENKRVNRLTSLTSFPRC